jgi:polar amino acid transport system substrate-binding protein
MARLIGFRGVLCVTVAVVWALGGRASSAETLRLVTETSPNGLCGSTGNDKAPGLSVEVLRQVFAAMGQDVSIEAFPVARSWMMVARGESDGIFSMTRISRQGEQICSFPEEPLKQERWVLFIRTADIGKL